MTLNVKQIPYASNRICGITKYYWVMINQNVTRTVEGVERGMDFK